MQSSNQSLVDQPDVLYRALNEKEIEGGNVLIPKSQEPFLAELRFPFMFSAPLGPTEEHAVRDHQSNGQYPTRGISTTFDKKIAFEKYGSINKVIAVICRSKLKEYEIKEFIVKDTISADYIMHPEDEEVVLVQDKDGNLPQEIIIEIIRVE